LSIVFALVWLWIFTGGLSNFIFGEWADSSPDPITFGNILKSLCLLLIINIIPLIIMAISIKTLWKLGRDNGDTTAVDKADKRGDEQRETQREPFDTKEDL
jgi:hypothetical protein